MPFPLSTYLDVNKGVLTLSAGTDDDDRGLRVGYAHESFPRIKITPDGQIFTGNGAVEPADVFTGGGGGANLGYTAAPTNGTVTSDTGTDATVSLADGTNAGLMAPAQHTKLDGIETGATADQTAAEILAALVTVDGAGSGLDADLLDGQSSAFYATATSVSDHLADTADTHDASAISILDTAGDFTATDVEGALAELATEKANDADVVKLTGDQTVAGVKLFTSAPKLANTVPLNGRNAAGSADVELIQVDSSDRLLLRGGIGQLGIAIHTDGRVGFGVSPDASARSHWYRDYTDVPSGVQKLGYFQLSAVGTKTVDDRRTGVVSYVADGATVVNKTVSGAVNNGSGLIRLTVTGHGLSTGAQIAVYAVTGTTEANGHWVMTSIDANTVDLQGSTFANAYVSGGTLTNRPMLYAFGAQVAPTLAREGLTGTAINGDDVGGFVATNVGTAKAVEAFYCGDNPAISGYQWLSQFTANAESDVGFLVGNTGDVDKAFAIGGAVKASGYGIDLYAGASGGTATWGASSQAIRLPNAKGVVGRNAAGSADIALVNLNASNLIEIGGATAFNIVPTTGEIAIGAAAVAGLPLYLKSTVATAFRATRDGAAITFELDNYATTGVSSFIGRKSLGTEASKTQVTANDDLARFGGAGYHSGSAFSVARGYMAVRSTESWSSTANGSKIVFLTTAATTTTTSLRLTIDENGLTFADALNIVVGSTTGLKLGTATTQKIGFWNATPIVQPAAYTQTYSTADRTHAARTATTLTDNSAGTANTTVEALGGVTYATDVAAIRNNFADLAAAVNALIVDLADTASVVNSLVDDHQAIGFCAP